jgi:hypothetical protein
MEEKVKCLNCAYSFNIDDLNNDQICEECQKEIDYYNKYGSNAYYGVIDKDFF